MKRVFINYEYWECFKSGMYRTESKEKIYIKKAILFMSDTERFSRAMFYVVANWKNTMLHHLSNSSINKRAFVGQCACSYAINCPEQIVRVVWKELTEKQRIDADFEAQKLIDNYIYKLNERQNNSVHHGLGIQMLFQWDSR